MASTMSQKETKPQKRKITDEGRWLNKKWIVDYVFVEADSKALCLICRDFVPVFKDYNLKNYIQNHALPDLLCIKECVVRTKQWN